MAANNYLSSILKFHGRENYEKRCFTIKNFLTLEGLSKCIAGTANDSMQIAKYKANIVLAIDSICSYERSNFNKRSISWKIFTNTKALQEKLHSELWFLCGWKLCIDGRICQSGNWNISKSRSDWFKIPSLSAVYYWRTYLKISHQW